MGSIRSTGWDKALGRPADLVQEVTPRSRGEGTRRVREMRRKLKKAALWSSLSGQWGLDPVRTTWDAYIKSPKSVHPEDRRLEHLSTVFCPPLVEGWPGVLTSPTLGLHVHGSWTGYRGIRGSLGREQEDTPRTHEAWHDQHKVIWTYMQLSTATMAKTEVGWGEMDMRSQRHLLHTSSRTILAKLLMLKEWTCHNCL